MGVLRKRGKYWHIDLRVHGNRIRKAVSGDKRLAELALKDLEVKAEREQLDFKERKDIPVLSFFAQFREYSATNHRPGTIKRYRAVLDNFLAFLKTREPNTTLLSQISPDLLERYKTHRKTVPITKNGKAINRVNADSIQQGAKSYTVNFELGTLRTAFYLAIKWGYLRTNPISAVIKLKTTDSRRRRFLTKEECQKLLKAATEPYRSVFYAFLNTGMRLSELTNLEWADIDLEKRIIKIQRKLFWLPKTGERIIPMNDAVFSLLKDIPKRSNFIFVQKRGKPFRSQSLRNNIIRIAKEAGISSLTEIHSLRHTFASHLLMGGADLPSVQKLLGHSKIETTMIYTHQTEGHLREAIAKIEF